MIHRPGGTDTIKCFGCMTLGHGGTSTIIFCKCMTHGCRGTGARIFFNCMTHGCRGTGAIIFFKCMTCRPGGTGTRIFVECMTYRPGRGHKPKNVFQMYDRRAMLFKRRVSHGCGRGTDRNNNICHVYDSRGPGQWHTGPGAQAQDNFANV